MTKIIDELSDIEVKQMLEDAWLGIKVDEEKLFNPLLHIPEELEEEPYLYILWLMGRPEYFSFVCSEIMNIQLLPMQSIILKEMWTRKFPMLIASRGGGKTFLMGLYALLRLTLLPGRRIVGCGAAFRQSKLIFEYMDAIWKNAPLLRDMVGSNNNGPKRDVDRCRFHINESVASFLPIGDGCHLRGVLTTFDDRFSTIERFSKFGSVNTNINIWGNGEFRLSDESYYNGKKETLKIHTKKGYSVESTPNHKFRVLRNGIDDWVSIDNMHIGDKILIDKSERWHNGNFDCATDESYGLGLLIADGSLSHKYNTGFATNDTELALAVKKLIDICPTSSNTLKQCKNDYQHWVCSSKAVVDWLKSHYGLIGCRSHDKEIPTSMLRTSRDVFSHFLSGLYDGDGHVFVSTAKGGTAISVNYTTVSKVLAKQLQYILLHYGIVSVLKSRQRKNKNWKRVYELGIYGTNVKTFADKINFRLLRKKQMLESAIKQKQRWRTQEKYHNDAFIDTIVDITEGYGETYDIHVPDGNEYCANGFFSHNSKIRGERANDILMDEFAATSREIFENVIAGFAAVKSSPVEATKAKAKEALTKKFGLWSPLKKSDSMSKDNQIIISGTAYYDFNHFSDYWKRWREIIMSQGKEDRLREIFGDDEDIPEDFDSGHYSIIRLPYELLPKGFMDEDMVARSKATIHSGIYLMEFGAVFSTDSNGFFKRSLIESCVANEDNSIVHPSGKVVFEPNLVGNPTRRYVYGVDPASEVDNFSIIVLEAHSDHRRIVYSWTTTRKEHKERLKMGLVNETDFYSYCARKIRDLMKKFPCELICMDSQGGGIAVAEALHDFDKIEDGELQIWPIIDPQKEKDTDGEAGLHLLDLINFASFDWTSEANHGLRKDFEDKACLFPMINPVTLGISSTMSESMGIDRNKLYDTLEDCIMEIEELKNELSSIIVTQTATGRDRWDTPEVKLPGNRKGRLRKDRYSALVMANMGARQMARNTYRIPQTTIGGFAAGQFQRDVEGPDYVGPAWFANKMKNVY